MHSTQDYMHARAVSSRITMFKNLSNKQLVWNNNLSHFLSQTN